MPTKPRAIDKAATWLHYGMRTEKEIRRYLFTHAYEDAEIEEAVAQLKAYDYLNDVRYAQSYFRVAAAKGKSRRRIETELQEKGIDRETFAVAIDALLAEETEEAADGVLGSERARALQVGMAMTRRQLADGKAVDQRFQARVGRRLSGLGYSTEMIYWVLDQLRAAAEKMQTMEDDESYG